MSAEWVAVICAIGGSAIGGFVGVRVAIASLKERVRVLEEEVKMLREYKHDHAGHITRHELQIEELMIRMRDER